MSEPTKPLSDTPPNIRKILVEGYRAMPSQKKARCVNEMAKALRAMALARIREQYGDISEREVLLRLGSLWLGRETMIRVFGWDPKKEGY
ncbi:MAG: hypothetical protein AB1646_18400 [Thermodesulfobacteriota bacterium]